MFSKITVFFTTTSPRAAGPSHVWEIRLINVKFTSDQSKSVLLISVLLISYPRFSVNFDA